MEASGFCYSLVLGMLALLGGQPSLSPHPTNPGHASPFKAASPPSVWDSLLLGESRPNKHNKNKFYSFIFKKQKQRLKKSFISNPAGVGWVTSGEQNKLRKVPLFLGRVLLSLGPCIGQSKSDLALSAVP